MGNFTITYDISFDGGVIWTNKIMIVKNSNDKIEAECKLSKYVKMKYEGVNTIRIIRCIGATTNINKDTLDSFDKGDINMDDIFSQFGDIFGYKNNPFSKNF